MRIFRLIHFCILTILFAGQAVGASKAEPLNVLIVTGGHGFKQEPFFKMFSDNPDIRFTHGEHEKSSATVYERDDLSTYDVVVLYDMPKNISEQQKQKFRSLLDKGTGLVVLHHALVSYQHWNDYEQIIGGRYPEEDGKGGVVTEAVGYKHDVEIPVTVLAMDHPVTKGLSDFTVHDEIYWGYRVGKDVTPLLSTTHPKSGKPLAWCRNEGKSRVVYIQLGHGPGIFADFNYRKLLGQSIRWVANKSGDGEWVSLFDGKTLDGWIQRGGKAKYRVEEGQIIGTSVPKTPNSFLCTTREYSNFILELDFKVDNGLNSGVQIRSQAYDTPVRFEWKGKQVQVPAGRVHGLQVEIDPSSRAWSAGIHEEGGRGWLNDLKTNEAARKAFKSGEWNSLRIECKGDSIKTWINDVSAADLRDERMASGFIGLQVHGVGERQTPMEVRFRNLRLKEL